MTAKVIPNNENPWLLRTNSAEISEVNANNNTKSLQELKNCVLFGSNLTALEHPVELAPGSLNPFYSDIY